MCAGHTVAIKIRLRVESCDWAIDYLTRNLLSGLHNEATNSLRVKRGLRSGGSKGLH